MQRDDNAPTVEVGPGERGDAPPVEPPTPSLRKRAPGSLRVALRIAAIGAVGYAAWLVLWGPATSECQTENVTVTKVGATTEEKTTSCKAVRPEVIDILPLVTLAGVLLLGELAELSIPGLLTLKTRVEEQQVRQERLERELIDVRFSASQSQSVVNQNYYPDPSYQNPQEASRSAHVKAEAEPGAKGTGDVDGVSVPDSPDLAALKYRVLEAYERISPFVYIAQDLQRMAPEQIYRRMPTAYRSALESLSPAHLDQLKEWFKRFRREIESVRAVRNSVAHPPALVTEDDLAATLDTLKTLQAELDRRDLGATDFG